MCFKKTLICDAWITNEFSALQSQNFICKCKSIICFLFMLYKLKSHMQNFPHTWNFSWFEPRNYFWWRPRNLFTLLATRNYTVASKTGVVDMTTNLHVSVKNTNCFIILKTACPFQNNRGLFGQMLSQKYLERSHCHTSWEHSRGRYLKDTVKAHFSVKTVFQGLGISITKIRRES